MAEITGNIENLLSGNITKGDLAPFYTNGRRTPNLGGRSLADKVRDRHGFLHRTSRTLALKLLNRAHGVSREVTFTAGRVTYHWHVLNHRRVLSLAITTSDMSESGARLSTNVT